MIDVKMCDPVFTAFLLSDEKCFGKVSLSAPLVGLGVVFQYKIHPLIQS